MLEHSVTILVKLNVFYDYTEITSLKGRADIDLLGVAPFFL